MSDWTSGYVADIGYTFGYYTELNPLRARLAFLDAGLVPPAFSCAHCELGYGQGMSINIHAAASGNEWYGTDFNPSQAGFAQELAAASGSGAALQDEAFADFCSRPDLPGLDFIGLHGIWSWISDENRTIIADFLRRKLKVGGVLYISYNASPGWAAMQPMREMLADHARLMSGPGQAMEQRIDHALAFAARLKETAPLFMTAHPQLAERLQFMQGQSRSYLAHEYFNRDWHPMSISRLAEWLAPAKLDYACSAHYLDHMEAINLKPAQQALLKEIPDAVFRESVRDLMVNQTFRRDYWVKGPRNTLPGERKNILLNQRVVLTEPPSEIVLKAKGALGEASMQKHIYEPIVEALSDHQPQTLAEIARGIPATIDFEQLVQAMMVLCGTGALHPAQSEEAAQRARVGSEQLNAVVMARSAGGEDIPYLASPVTGGGIRVPAVSQQFLLARKKGLQTPQEWAEFAWQKVQAIGQKLIKEGNVLETDAENLAELKGEADTFAATRLPMYQQLGIA